MTAFNPSHVSRDANKTLIESFWKKRTVVLVAACGVANGFGVRLRVCLSLTTGGQTR
jgi:hypothetical protein